jgi:ribosome-associated protein
MPEEDKPGKDRPEVEHLLPSKSEIKRQMTALQKVGTELVNLSPRELARIPIADEALMAAIMTARKIRSNIARKRQLQFIGKLLRTIDTQPILDALEELHQRRKGNNAAFQELELLRDELLKAGTAGVEDILHRYPDADRQRLRQLVMQHQKEVRNNKPPAASRKLFKYLRELQSALA